MNIAYSFFHHGDDIANAMRGYYDYTLVVLSYFVAVIASYVALDLIGGMREEPDRQLKKYWLIGGAFTLGAGIWSMHFIGMLAYVLPVQMSYSIGLTVGSLLIAILASFLAMSLLKNLTPSSRKLMSGGVLIGLGIVIMHYMGMEAMVANSRSIKIVYIPWIFVASIVIGIAASEAALWLAIKSNIGPRVQQLRLKLFSALVMGVAICGMHYSGMAAAIIFPSSQPASMRSYNVSMNGLAFYIGSVMVLIIVVALILSAFRHLNLRTMQEEEMHKVQQSLEKRVSERTKELDTKNKKLIVALDELQKLQQYLIQTEKMSTVGELTAGIAHEINNPLGYTLSNINMMQKRMTMFEELLKLVQMFMDKLISTEPLQDITNKILLFNEQQKPAPKLEEIKEILVESEEGLMRIKKIVDDLRTFTMATDQDKHPVDISACVESAILLGWNEIKYKCTLKKDFATIPVFQGYPNQLTTVILNMLTNAAQAIEKQGSIFIVTTSRDGMAVISIKDTGCGIDPESLTKIFTPFFSTRPIGKGKGLGLSTAYNLVKLMGGKITVESKINNGSTFIIEVPMSKSAI